MKPTIFNFFDIRALWRSVLSARVPECQKIKKDGLDQYGPEHFEVWPFDTTELERVNMLHLFNIAFS